MHFRGLIPNNLFQPLQITEVTTVTAAVSEHGELPFLELTPLEEGVEKTALLLLYPDHVDQNIETIGLSTWHSKQLLFVLYSSFILLALSKHCQK